MTIRSTFIVGFPGETDDDFAALLDFLREAQLDRVGCFAYSPVAGAAANALPGQVAETVKEERRARFMQVQQEVSRARLKAKVGQTLQVLVDAVNEDGAIARSQADAPEIDGLVYVKQHKSLKAGEFASVRVKRATHHDLHAEVAA